MMNRVKRGLTLATVLLSLNSQAGTLCTPDSNTAFTEYENMAFKISNDAMGNNSLYSYCTDLSNESLLGAMNSCTPAPANPINGLGLNPTDKLLYGLSPTDALGIGTHLEMTIPFPSPGQPGDIMKADPADIYKIGNDGGFLNVGFIQPPPESGGLPADTHQVAPIVHNAASFNQSGDLFVLAYRTNYTSSADIPMGTAEVLYQSPQVVIGEISNADLLAANGGSIPVSWTNITMDPTCDNVVNEFTNHTNVFSVCVVNHYLSSGDQDAAVQSCIASTPILDMGIHDFAVSPADGHFYGYDSMTLNGADVLVNMDPASNTASCIEIPDPGNSTGVLSSVMFSQQNKLLTLFANQSTGGWIDVSTGARTALTPSVTASPYGDGSSLPFALVPRPLTAKRGGGPIDLIFKNGFEDFIFRNGFEGPGISLLKTAQFNDSSMDGLAQPGETIDYFFTVTNTGIYDLSNVSITDPLISVPGSLPLLAVGASDNSTFSGTYVITQNDIDQGSVSNLASAHASDPFNNPVSASSNDGMSLVTPLPHSVAISLIKSGVFVDIINDGVAGAGDRIDYSFTVNNTGTQTLSNITITDPLMSVPGMIANLAPGASDSSTLSGSYTLTQSDIDAGEVSNSATVFAEDPDSNSVSAPSNGGVAHIVSLAVTSSVELIKAGAFVDTIADGVAGVGDTINYTFTVTNTGTQTLSAISISDPLLPVPGNLSSLSPGQSDNSTFNAVYTLNQNDIDAGSVSNLATVHAENPATDPVSADSNNGVTLVTSFSPVASISLVKTGSFNDTSMDGLAQPGETITYNFTVSNTGSLTLGNITVTDPLITVPGNIASLAPGASDSSTFSGTYELTQADIDSGMVSNLATVHAQDPSMNPISSESNAGVSLVTALPVSASVSLSKSGVFDDANMDGLAQSGEDILYTFSVTNTGNVTLTNLTISDPLMTVNGSIASLAPGATDSMTFSESYSLTQADIDNGQVSNLASVSGTDPDSAPVTAQSNGGMNLITVLPTLAELNLLKTGLFNDTNMDGYAQAGETISYFFTVVNTGNQTITSITLEDPLMSTPGEILSLAPGDSDNSTFSGVYTLTQNDLDNGSVSNLAMVHGSDPDSGAVSDSSNGGVPYIVLLPIFSCPDF